MIYDSENSALSVPAPASTFDILNKIGILKRPDVPLEADELEHQDGAGQYDAPRHVQAQTEAVRVGRPSPPHNGTNQHVLLHSMPVLQHESRGQGFDSAQPYSPASSDSGGYEKPRSLWPHDAPPAMKPLEDSREVHVSLQINRELDAPRAPYAPTGADLSTADQRAGDSEQELEAWDVGDAIPRERSFGDAILDPDTRPKKKFDCNLLGWILYQIAAGYGRNVLARRPGCCALFGIILVLVITGLGMAFMPPDVDTDFSSFMKTDVKSSTVRDSFLDALSARQSVGRRLQSDEQQLRVFCDILIAYELKEESSLKSVFEIEFMRQVSNFEKTIVNIPEWVEYCQTSEEDTQYLCKRGVSVVGYVMPSLQVDQGQVVPSALILNRTGGEMLPLETTVRLLKQHEIEKLLLPNMDIESPEATRVVRSAFRFSFFCCYLSDSKKVQRSERNRLSKIREEFLRSTLLPFLEEYQIGKPKARDLPFNIWYTTDKLSKMVVMDSLFADVRLAGGSILFVLAYVLFHTRSVFLSLVGLFLVLLSVPFSYVVFAVLAGTQTMSIASFLSLFLVVGLGSDVIFVYTDLWRDSIRIRSNESDRIVWTLIYAGKASLATTITTALSFFANLASVLKPLREFGVYMGLCVVLVWLLISMIFLPVCVVDARYCMCCTIRCCLRSQMATTRSGKPSQMARSLGCWQSVLFRWRRSCLALFVLLAVLALVLSILNAEVDTAVPNIFPDDHNLNRGKEVMSKFAPGDDVFPPSFLPLPSTVEVCKEHEYTSNDRFCPIFWCEVDASIRREPEHRSCHCFRRENDVKEGFSFYAVVQRFVGASISDVEMRGAIFNRIVPESVPESERNLFPLIGQDRAQLSPILLQNWENGDIQLEAVTQVTTQVSKSREAKDLGWQELCFCGSYVCQLPPRTGFRQVEPLTLPGRRLADPVQPRQVPSNKRVSVEVVFGILVKGGSLLLGERNANEGWSFSPRFQLEEPWTQRNIVGLCDNTPSDLRVVNAHCFLQVFRDWLQANGRKFPVPAPHFHSLAIQFSNIGAVTPNSLAKDYVWVKDDRIMAMYVPTQCDFNKHSPTKPALEYKEQWDKYMDEWNLKASYFAKGAWHTSQLWVQAEAQEELISSTALTIAIVIIMSFLGMLTFTFDLLLSLLVVASTMEVICGLFFFMTCMMGWAIGPIEVVALIVFIGYAVTYSLHIAHKFGDGEALTSEPPRPDLKERTSVRYQRTGFALKSIGSAAVGSAVTTMGCSMFLLFCELQIFKKLGGVVLAVTIMSIVTALAPLPAALLLCGPVRPGTKCCLTPEHRERCVSVLKPCISGLMAWYRQHTEADVLRVQQQFPDASRSEAIAPPRPCEVLAGSHTEVCPTPDRRYQGPKSEPRHHDFALPSNFASGCSRPPSPGLPDERLAAACDRQDHDRQESNPASGGSRPPSPRITTDKLDAACDRFLDFIEQGSVGDAQLDVWDMDSATESTLGPVQDWQTSYHIVQVINLDDASHPVINLDDAIHAESKPGRWRGSL